MMKFKFDKHCIGGRFPRMLTIVSSSCIIGCYATQPTIPQAAPTKIESITNESPQPAPPTAVSPQPLPHDIYSLRGMKSNGFGAPMVPAPLVVAVTHRFKIRAVRYSLIDFQSVSNDSSEATLERLDPPGVEERGKDVSYRLHFDRKGYVTAAMSVGNEIDIGFDGENNMISLKVVEKPR